MAEQPSPPKPTSPVSIVLRTLGMTREDLVVHTEQFRAHLYRDTPSEPDLLPAVKARPLRRSRTTPIPNTTRTRSPSPPQTPVKSEPVDTPVPPRQMDTMQLVMERKRKQAKKERRGVYPHCGPFLQLFKLTFPLFMSRVSLPLSGFTTLLK